MDTFLFDLDGTLLPMDQEYFTRVYFKGIAKKLIPYGFEEKTLINTINEGVMAMILNDGTITHEERFWTTIIKFHGEEIRDLEPVFLDYYNNEFQDAKVSTSVHPLVKESILQLKKKGYRIILATNPLFPPLATHKRIKWAGLEPEDFELVTTFDNSSYCKPNIKYYQEILSRQGLSSSQCLMVGNNVKEEMIATTIGIEGFLVTDCLINPDGVDISKYRNGSINDLFEYIKELPHV